MRTPKLLLALAGLLIIHCIAAAQSGLESAADSLRGDTLVSGVDTFHLAADSLRHSDAVAAWFVPLGMIVATGVAIFLLFSTRSR